MSAKNNARDDGRTIKHVLRDIVYMFTYIYAGNVTVVKKKQPYTKSTKKKKNNVVVVLLSVVNVVDADVVVVVVVTPIVPLLWPDSRAFFTAAEDAAA